MYGREAFLTSNSRLLSHVHEPPLHELPHLSEIPERWPNSEPDVQTPELPELYDLDIQDPSPPDSSINTEVPHDLYLWQLQDERRKESLGRADYLLTIDDLL